MELVVPAPPGIGNGLKRGRCIVGHHRRFGCACVLLLEVDLLGFPPVVPVSIGLDLVLVKGLCDLAEQADLDVRFRVLASHDGAKLLQCEKEQIDGMFPPECASGGAINPKTHRKWVWAYIEAVAKLVDKVVSVFIVFSYLSLQYDLCRTGPFVAAIVAMMLSPTPTLPPLLS